MQRSKSLHEIYESFAQTCVKLPFAHSSPAKFQMATRKPLKYVKTWKTQLEDGTFEIIEGWPASSQRRHLRFKLCSSQFLDGDPGPIFEAGRTECFRTLAEKSGIFLFKSLLPKIFKGPTSSISSQTYFVVLEACLNLASFWTVNFRHVWKAFDAEPQPFLLKAGQLNANGRCLVFGYIGVNQDLTLSFAMYKGQVCFQMFSAS